jgi:predicted secreted hydrolase
MAVSGSLRVLGDAAGQSANATQAVKGVAWLDHEWSSEAMAAQAVGWDWVGLNMEDGGALMAFRLRDAKGGVVWAGGTHRRTDGQVQRFAPQDVRFEVLRHWRSPHSGASYPVAMAVVLGRAADAMRLELKPLMDDQELDARASTGNYYWEGAVRSSAMNTAEHSRKLLNGRGYLELTGYWRAQKL